MIRPRYLFVCSCIALVTSAFTFVVRGDILQDLGDAFSLSQEQRGGIEGAVFLGMFASMLGGGFICDFLGMKRIMWLAFASHLIGSLGTIMLGTEGAANLVASPGSAYVWIYALGFLMGCGNGFTEVAINPLAATLFPDQKTHYLNVLHAWWPGGLVIGGLSMRFVVRPFYEGNADLFGPLALWQVALFLITLPTIVYGLMLLTAKFPETERVASGVSNREMLTSLARPMFVLWAVCMLMTASTELGPQKWQESVMQSTAGVSGTLILVYTSGMMFVLRHFAGPLARMFSPTGMMCVSAALACVGLFLLSTADSAVTAFGYATIFGLGIAYFWPTMLGVTAERFAKGGALALALMGSVGNLAIWQILPAMGQIVDVYSVRHVEENSPEFADQLIAEGGSGKRILNVDTITALEAEH